MFEGIDRIPGSGFESWVNTEDDADKHSSEESNSDYLPTDIRGEWSNNRKQEGK